MHVGNKVGGVARHEDGFEVHAVEEGVDATGRLDVHRIRRRVGDRVRQVQRDAQLVDGAIPQRLHRQAVRQVLMMDGGQRRARVAEARRVLAAGVPDQ